MVYRVGGTGTMSGKWELIELEERDDKKQFMH